MTSVLPFPEELGKGRIGLADENDISEVLKLFRLNRGHRTADDRENAAIANFAKDFAQAPPLNAHAGNTHHVGTTQTIEIDLLDVLIDKRHVVVLGNECGQQGQAGNRQVGALAEHSHAFFHAPKGNVKTRIDDDDIGHDQLPTQTIMRETRSAKFKLSRKTDIAFNGVPSCHRRLCQLD